MQICTKCHSNKPFVDFYKDKSKKDGYRPSCKDCDDISRPKVKRAEYYKKTKTERKKQSLRYYEEHKDERKKYRLNRLMTNVIFRISDNLRSRMYGAIKNNFKAGSAVKDLGCTIPEFKLYIEKQFKKGMCWENHNREGWHIDHIKPLSSFNLNDKEQFLKASHFTNQQPLWANENRSKGKRYV